MGKFGTYKRLDTLLCAFDILREDPQLSNYELVIAGSNHPATPGYVETVAQSRQTDPGIKFHGYLAEEDIPEFFATARVSVFDYNATTGSSGVLHQTASYGALPVFPNIGDFVDVCRDEGISGLNYDPMNPRDMARAIHEALLDEERSEKMIQSNMSAAQEMPFSDVVDFHVQMLFAK
jgi:glycosyltransferase involved in cell wall biosynthesis